MTALPIYCVYPPFYRFVLRLLTAAKCEKLCLRRGRGLLAAVQPAAALGEAGSRSMCQPECCEIFMIIYSVGRCNNLQGIFVRAAQCEGGSRHGELPACAAAVAAALPWASRPSTWRLQSQQPVCRPPRKLQLKWCRVHLLGAAECSEQSATWLEPGCNRRVRAACRPRECCLCRRRRRRSLTGLPLALLLSFHSTA